MKLNVRALDNGILNNNNREFHCYLQHAVISSSDLCNSMSNCHTAGNEYKSGLQIYYFQSLTLLIVLENL